MTAAKQPTPDTEFNLKYQLLAKIGSGGMGDVFLGIQRGAVDFSRLVVIKRIHDRDLPPEQAEATAKMFLNEAGVVASLNHPHIVKIFDFLMDGSALCIVMEYVEGETLRYLFTECVKHRIRFPVGAACNLIHDACNTLHYAHNQTSKSGKANHIVHRDIGLHNLMLDSAGYLKIIDFGIAKSSIQTDMTTPGMLKGNPSYMAPELFSKKTADHRVDIYALGLCLYELLTQTRAYQFNASATVGEVICEITERALPLPSSQVPDLPTGIDEVVMRATAKNREERYPTMEAFGQDLKRIAGGVFMADSETRAWLIQNFSTRLTERQEFESKLVQYTGRSDSDPEVSLPSKLPQGFQIVSGITDSFARKPPSSGRFSKRMFTWSAAGLSALGIVFALTYFGVHSNSPSTPGPPEVVDNLVVSCEPSGARLSIDGKDFGSIGKEAISFRVAPNQKHEVVISKSGYRDLNYPFVAPARGAKTINAKLFEIKTENVASPLPSPGALNAVSTDGETVAGDDDEKVKNTQPQKIKEKHFRLKRKTDESAPKTPTAEESLGKRKIPLPDDDELM